jgi:hypothetical protein
MFEVPLLLLVFAGFSPSLPSTAENIISRK